MSNSPEKRGQIIKHLDKRSRWRMSLATAIPAF
jgi:hypothetical protein